MPNATHEASDTPQTNALQISVLWEDHLLEVQSFRAPCCLCLPSEPGPVRHVSVRELGAHVAAVLDFPQSGQPELICQANADGTLDGGNRCMPLADASQPLPEDGAARVALQAGHRLRLRVGPLTYVIEVASREAIRGIRARERWGKGTKLGLVATTLLHLGTIAAMLLLSSPTIAPGEVTDEQLELMRRYLRASAEREGTARDNGALDEKEGGMGTRATGDRAGEATRFIARHRYGVAGPGGGVANAPAEFGMIGLMHSGGGAAWQKSAAGHAAGSGFGSGHGRLGPSHRTRPPIWFVVACLFYCCPPRCWLAPGAPPSSPERSRRSRSTATRSRPTTGSSQRVEHSGRPTDKR
ncbi:MAG: hypothetical protein ACOC1F_11820 [Myxococcota bacterium]